MTNKEKVFYLREKYGASVCTCAQFIRNNPNFENLDSKTVKLTLGYIDWLKTFLDGDRSFERYLKEIGEH